MKLNLNKKGQAGMTLIEITLVIAVLLGLISVLFIGVAAYKKGSDRAKCILNIATVQKAARSYANLYEISGTGALGQADIAGAGKMIETVPVCPGDGAAYNWGTTNPAPSAAFITCANLAVTEGHAPNNTDGW